MHLQQTKRESRKSGGPQYYLHDLTDEVYTYLRKKRAVPVALMTPYGATRSSFIAISRDHKLQGERVVSGRVGHDRIQQASAAESIGEAIRRWFGLRVPADFERIDVEIEIRDAKFHVTPTTCRMVGRPRLIQLPRPVYPLSLNQHMESRLWREQLKWVQRTESDRLDWAFDEIKRIVAAYQPKETAHILEPDLLRASGALKMLGIELGPYLGKGYDCRSQFKFLQYPAYDVPVELKKKSSNFKYQQQKYGKEELSRAVVLCMQHDLVNVPPNVDVIELGSIAKWRRLLQ